MKHIHSLSLLLLLAVVTANPRSPVVVEELSAADDVPAEPQRDSWSLTKSLDQVPSTLQDDEEEEDFDDDDEEEEDSNREVKFRVDNENDSDEDDNDDEHDLKSGLDLKSFPSTGSGESFKETRRRLIEDYISLEHDLQLIRRLLGLTPNTDTIGYSNFGLWDLPGSDERTEDDDHPAFGLGFNPPIFSNFPGLPIEPSFPKVDDLPDNYDNSTHEVHVVNGSRVEVNTTTNKESGDGFQSFYRDEVIAIQPVDDKHNTTGTQTEVKTGEEEPAKEEQLPPLPEVENEADKEGKSSSTLPEVDLKVEADTVTTTEVASTERTSRISRGAKLLSLDTAPDTLHLPGHRTAPLISRLPRDVADDAETVQVNEGKHLPPDLSKDTRVNYADKGHQGMVKVDPDSEIFNLTLVLVDEAKTNIDDK